MASRKAWDDLKPSYRARMAANGLSRENWSTPEGDRLRQKARGHGKTPERPDRAMKNPERYGAYLQSRSDLVRQVIARKERLFGDRIKFNTKRSAENVQKRQPGTQRLPSPALLRKFMSMSELDIQDVDYRDDEWSFLFYH